MGISRGFVSLKLLFFKKGAREQEKEKAEQVWGFSFNEGTLIVSRAVGAK